MDYIKLKCEKCSTINSLILKSNNICKCQSCLKEFSLLDLIEKQLINQNKRTYSREQEGQILNIIISMAHSDNGTPILYGIDEILKFAKKVLDKFN